MDDYNKLTLLIAQFGLLRPPRTVLFVDWKQIRFMQSANQSRRRVYDNYRGAPRTDDRYRRSGGYNTGGWGGGGGGGGNSNNTGGGVAPRRMDYERRHQRQESDPYYNRERRRYDRGDRYGGVRRETILNGSYNDYMREFAHSTTPHVTLHGYGAPQQNFHVDVPNSYSGYNSRPQRNHGYESNNVHMSDYNSSRNAERRSASKYERDVADFLRRTGATTGSGGGGGRDSRDGGRDSRDGGRDRREQRHRDSRR